MSGSLTIVESNVFLAQNFDGYWFSVFHSSDTECLYIYFPSSRHVPRNCSLSFKFSLKTNDKHIETTFKFTNMIYFLSLADFQIPSSIMIKPIKESKSDYVGIRNMGMTCYIASTLQMLYSLPSVRNLLYSEECSSDSVCYKMQKVFLELAASCGAVSLIDFVSSFGKNTSNMILHENDAHEFMTMLLDKLDTEQGKDFTKRRLSLMGITSTRIISCLNVDLKSEVDEIANEIQVPVLGFTNLVDSLRSITSSEKLVGENQWDAGKEHGKMDAERFMRFKNLPPVIFFQLCRFSYNLRTMETEEVRTYFDCPDEIDMGEFCTETMDCSKYRIVSILAHKGSPRTGHYITFSKPNVNSPWLVFNDSQVSKTDNYGVKKCFGGNQKIKDILSLFGLSGFLSYIVAYERCDVQIGKNSISAKLSPFFSNSYHAKITRIGDFKSPSLESTSQIIEWSKEETKISDLVTINNENVFYLIPGECQIFGPISNDSEACKYCLNDPVTTFLLVPKSIGHVPLLLWKDQSMSFVSINEISSMISSNIELKHDNRVLTSISDLYPGSIIHYISNDIVTIIVSEFSIKIPINGTYEDIQREINPQFPNKVLLYSDNNPLYPNQYNTVRKLLNLSKLNYIILKDPQTVQSLDMYKEISILFTNKNHQTQHVSKIRVPSHFIIKDITDNISQWFENPSECEYYVSKYSLSEIGSSIPHTSTLLYKDLRVDCIESIRTQTHELIQSLKNNDNSSIELRKYDSSNKSMTTLGFYRITQKTTASSLLKSTGITAFGTLSIRSSSSTRTGFTIQKDAVLLNALKTAAESHNMTLERPFLLVQLQ